MKTIFITGGNSGLGFETARQFLLSGDAVIIGCRDKLKGDIAVDELNSATNNKNITTVVIDLCSFLSIRKCVTELSNTVDILICNAGVAFDTIGHRTHEGIEETFGVNHLGHFLLTNLLLKKFSTSLRKIVVISSSVHDPKVSKGMFPAPEISSVRALAYPIEENVIDKKKVAGLNYVNSKLCNLLFTYELNRKFLDTKREDVSVNAFNPGFMPATNLGRNNSTFTKFMLKYVLPKMKLIISGMKSSEQSAKDIVNLCQHDKGTGKYFDGLKEVKSSDLSYSIDKADELWTFSVELVKLTEAETIFSAKAP